MHELGIVFHIIKAVEETARKNGANQINTVTMELGEVSGIIPHELTSCWDWAVKKHPGMENAQLILETIPAVTLCENCGQKYSTISQGRTCPRCGSGHTYLIQGNETTIKEIEIY